MKNRAFTIMEVIVVVIIVGILAAVTVSLYSEYIMNAKMSELLTLASFYDNQVQALVLKHGWDTDFLDELKSPGNTFETGKYFSATGIGFRNTNPSYFAIYFSAKLGVSTVRIADRFIYEDGHTEWFVYDASNNAFIPWVNFLKKRLPNQVNTYPGA